MHPLIEAQPIIRQRVLAWLGWSEQELCWPTHHPLREACILLAGIPAEVLSGHAAPLCTAYSNTPNGAPIPTSEVVRFARDSPALVEALSPLHLLSLITVMPVVTEPAPEKPPRAPRAGGVSSHLARAANCVRHRSKLRGRALVKEEPCLT